MMLLSIGKPMIDILVEVDNEFLIKYGLKPNDACKAAENQAGLFKEILKFKPKYVSGGSVTNTLRVFQWAMGNNAKVFYIGAIGNDHFGTQIKNQLENENIDYIFWENDMETVQCAVLISNNGKNRSLVTNSNLKPRQTIVDTNIALDEFKERIKTCSCFYVQTFSLIMFANLIKETVEYCLSNEKNIVMNLGATYVLEKESDNVKFLLKHADVVIGNDEEYRILAKIFNILDVDLRDIIKSLRFKQKKDTTLVVTRGAGDILTYSNGSYRSFNINPVQYIVDTTGAGDAFAGGFLSQYVKKLPLESCIHIGIACASHIIQHFGCDFDRNHLF